MTPGTLTGDTEQTELRAQVRAALAALNPVEREVSELNLRHQLSGSDLGDVLGITRGHAQALAATARSQFERSLGVLLVTRFERECLPHLAAILGGGGGKLTALLGAGGSSGTLGAAGCVPVATTVILCRDDARPPCS